jgi:hypothetical protein
VIAARLAEQMPQTYADTSPEAISAELRGLGVPSVNVKWDGSVPKGARRAEVTKAAAKRDKLNGE